MSVLRIYDHEIGGDPEALRQAYLNRAREARRLANQHPYGRLPPKPVPAIPEPPKAQESCGTEIPQKPVITLPTNRVAEIIEVVAKAYDLTPGDIRGYRRPKEITFPRQIVFFLAVYLTSRSLPEIGRAVGGKDHTTVLHGQRKISEKLGIENRFSVKNHEAAEYLIAEFKAGTNPKVAFECAASIYGQNSITRRGE